MLPQPPSLAGMPVWIFRGTPCLIGWEDDPSFQGRLRLVVRRYDDDSMDLLGVITRSVSVADQVKMLGRLLLEDEVIVDGAMAQIFQKRGGLAGLVSMSGASIRLGDGDHLVGRRLPCHYSVRGLRLPAW